MPMLQLDIVMRPGERLAPNLVQNLADGAGRIFGSPPGGTWVRLRTVAREAYAENMTQVGEVYPVFVDVVWASLPARDVLQAEVMNLTELVARLCRRPEANVHIIYQPPGAGRVAFGGKLVTE